MGAYAYFYIWTLRTSGKQYVGVTMQKIEERIRQHCKPSSNCAKLRNAIQKYGVDAFDIEWFEWCDEWDLAYIETLLIEELDTLSPKGFNLKKGGGNYGSLSEETKKKQSDANRGEKNPMFGNGHLISGEKNGMFGNGHLISGEKHGMFGKGHLISGEKNGMFGKTGEKHHASKKVYQYDLDGNYIRSFGSYREAGRSINKHHSYISACAHGDKKPDCNFRWSTEFIPDLARWTHTIMQ